MSKKLVVIVLAIGVIVGIFVYKPEWQFWNKPKFVKPKVIGAIHVFQHNAAYDSFKQGMAGLGYKEGRDVVYDEVKILPGPTFAEDIHNAVNKISGDHVDLIFIILENMVDEAIANTKTSHVPIVYVSRFHDPVSYGIAASFKSSGNNATGVSSPVPETVQKMLSLFKEINPKIKKIGMFTDGFMFPREMKYADLILSEIKKQAPRLGLTIIEYKTAVSPEQAETEWHKIADKIKPGDIEGLIHLPGHFYATQEIGEKDLAARLHIPHAVPTEDMPNGGTFAFDDDVNASARQAAKMVDKIFKGSKPSEIPIEFGAKSILILNLKRAQEAGFSFPNSMTLIAQEKITE